MLLEMLPRGASWEKTVQNAHLQNLTARSKLACTFVGKEEWEKCEVHVVTKRDCKHVEVLRFPWRTESNWHEARWRRVVPAPRRPVRLHGFWPRPPLHHRFNSVCKFLTHVTSLASRHMAQAGCGHGRCMLRLVASKLTSCEQTGMTRVNTDVPRTPILKTCLPCVFVFLSFCMFIKICSSASNCLDACPCACDNFHVG